MTFEKGLMDIPKPAINPEAMDKTIAAVQAIAAQKRSHVVRGFKSSFLNASLYTAASMLLGFIISGTLFVSSAYSLPGSFLYPIKLISEKVVYSLHTTPDGKAELKIEFSQKRLDELTRIYKKKGLVDKQILAIFLKEAEASLKLSEALPQPQKQKLQHKIKLTHDAQMQCLSDMEKDASNADKAMLEACREHCRKMMMP
jgi:hypothetical protein